MATLRSSVARMLACCVLLGAACGQGDEAPQAEPADTTVTVGAEDVVVVEQSSIETGPRLSGSLEPRLKSMVRAEVGGAVLAVKVERGQQVKSGQLLARIEARTLGDSVASAQAQVRTADHQLQLAKREAERTSALVKGGGLAARDLDTATSAVVAAEARLEEARARLATTKTQFADATIRAPITGVVSERAVNEGDVVAPGTLLFTIIDPSTMRLEAAVRSDELAALEVGAPVRFTVRGYPNQAFEGRIEWISPAADPGTRQIPILVAIPNQDGKLIANLFAEGRVTSESRNALVVPRDAVDDTGTAPTVARVVNNTVERVPVTLGIRDPDAEVVEVTKGLAAGDLVLVRGARDLAAGTPVELATPSATGAPEGEAPAKTEHPVTAPAASGKTIERSSVSGG